MTGSRYRDGARLAAPIAIAVLAFGATFGVLSRAAGMGIAAPLVMSATTFAGSAQFAAASILGAAGGSAAAIAAALLLNARYVPISVSAAPGFSGGTLRRLLGAQLIVDESWAIASRRNFDFRVLAGAGLVLYVAWNTGTAIGVLGGGALGDPRRLGLDAAFPALFLALLVPQVRTRRALTAALLAAAVAFALIPFAAPGIPIVAASAVCLLGWRRG
ncbi:MAG: AzlC family ABC transporter permease [Thermoleophilia bacterium]